MNLQPNHSKASQAQRVAADSLSALDALSLDFEKDAEVVENLLQQPDRSRMQIGEYIARQYYSNSRKEFEDHRTKDYSLSTRLDTGGIDD